MLPALLFLARRYGLILISLALVLLFLWWRTRPPGDPNPPDGQPPGPN